MARNKTNEIPRSNSIDVSAPLSNGLMAAWDGIYWAFGGRYESIEVTPEGLVVHGFSVEEPYNPDTIVHDVNIKGRRVPLFPTLRWINGETPEGFTTAQEMTQYQVANFRGSVEEGSTRTPKYVRDAFAKLKAGMGIAGKRGPKPQTLKLKNLSTLDASVLRNAKVSAEDLQHLIAVAEEAIASQAAAEVSTPETVNA